MVRAQEWPHVRRKDVFATGPEYGEVSGVLVVHKPKLKTKVKEHVLIHDRSCLFLFETVFADRSPHEFVWTDIASFDARLSALLTDLQVPQPVGLPYGFRSLRPTGTTHWYLTHGGAGLPALQRRGRWATDRMFAVYLQEVVADIAQVSRTPRVEQWSSVFDAIVASPSNWGCSSHLRPVVGQGKRS